MNYKIKRVYNPIAVNKNQSGCIKEHGYFEDWMLPAQRRNWAQRGFNAETEVALKYSFESNIKAGRCIQPETYMGISRIGYLRPNAEIGREGML